MISRENQSHTNMYCLVNRDPVVSWTIMTKLAMMVKMLLEMLNQKSASDTVPFSALAQASPFSDINILNRV